MSIAMSESPNPNGSFPATSWTAISNLQGDEVQARKALDYLCRIYWFPLFVFARRLGLSPDDAMDRTQDFFARPPQDNIFKRADREKGRMRTFLLTAFRRLIISEWRRTGGSKPPVSLEDAETRYSQLLVDHMSPEVVFERQWAKAILLGALGRLKRAMSSPERAALLEAQLPYFLGSAGEANQAEAAARLGLSEEAFRQSLLRTKRRFSRLVKVEIAETMENPTAAEIEDELEEIKRALRAGKP